MSLPALFLFFQDCFSSWVFWVFRHILKLFVPVLWKILFKDSRDKDCIWICKLPLVIIPSHSLLETLQNCHIGHWQENIIQSAQYSVQDTPQPGLCLLLPSHFSLALCPMTCKMPNDWHVQGVILFHGPGSLNHFFISELFFPHITPFTKIPLFTQFLKYSLSQEAILIPLWPQTSIFSSITYICLHYSYLTLLLAECLSFHLDYKLHEGRHSFICHIILHIIVCI